jgi:hypothetical protein
MMSNQMLEHLRGVYLNDFIGAFETLVFKNVLSLSSRAILGRVSPLSLSRDQGYYQFAECWLIWLDGDRDVSPGIVNSKPRHKGAGEQSVAVGENGDKRTTLINDSWIR